MLSVPLPIVVALMLLTVMLVNREALLALPSGRWFLALLGVYCIVLVLIGIRWTVNTMSVMPFLPILAVSWCILTWIAFRSLTRSGPAISATDWPHLASLLISLGRKGEDALSMVKFGAARNCHRAIWFSAGMLVYFALIEIIIALDFELWRGKHAAMIVTLANVPPIFLLGLVAAGAGRAGSRADSSEVTNSEADNFKELNRTEPDYVALMDRLTGLLVGQGLYVDTELNLQRLARKAGVPSRQVSRAVNSQSGLNVSQWVNEARIKAACELLRDSDCTILEIMDKVGFATKSNFNREFRRVTGDSPSNWRLSARRN